MRYAVFDVEANGLLQDATKIYCLSYQIFNENGTTEKRSLTSYSEIRDFFQLPVTFVGHNIVRYDIPLIEKLLEIKISDKIFDTLGISWYLYSERPKHGLEAWGVDLGIFKVEITDWQRLTIEEYVKRCEKDVEINVQLFLQEKAYLDQIYKDPSRIIGYVNFKLSCLKDQEEEGIDLDVELCLRTKELLETIINQKIENLRAAMPLELGKIIRSKPKVRTDSWNKYLQENNLPMDIEVIRDPPSPTSHTQLKKWLFDLGWIPFTFKFSKATKKKVPQISLPSGQGLCHSVKELYEKEPNLKELDGLYVATHRLSLINGFLESVKDGKVYSTAHGFTNTMRLEHSKPIVNLPRVGKPYGTEIRGCLKTPSGEYLMCGADISGLEDNTKQHYIYYFDPKYVTEMRVPGFDPHIDIALIGNMITQEDADFFKEYEKLSKDENLNPLMMIRRDIKLSKLSDKMLK
jgi:hypothetical protein